MLVILLLTLTVAIVGWFRPVSVHEEAVRHPSYSDAQVREAKVNVCAAYEQVRKAGDVAGARPSDGTDATARLAVATSTRQVLDTGGRYLLTRLAELPATPNDLALAIRQLANVYQQLTIDYLAEVPDSELDPLLRAGNETHSRIQSLCR
ncbi:hypothetical protein BST27_11415 [Mycobacterium intermedium]|uniref:Alanine and proline rich membrane protein n=2 Tax=Mycobacterium intermedium TaxID=28445 RepID=A0A1T3WBG1_MYCIE|nr:hypothetical protein BV508_05460 [Mycobacterium intermedium]ORB06102.1 hypothetical protein BST27_11415 [Mycobacterium intermedium]